MSALMPAGVQESGISPASRIASSYRHWEQAHVAGWFGLLALIRPPSQQGDATRTRVLVFREGARRDASSAISQYATSARPRVAPLQSRLASSQRCTRRASTRRPSPRRCRTCTSCDGARDALLTSAASAVPSAVPPCVHSRMLSGGRSGPFVQRLLYGAFRRRFVDVLAELHRADLGGVAVPRSRH